MPDTTDEYNPPADDQDDVIDLDVATSNVAADPADTDPEPPADEQPAEDKPSSNREAKYRVQLRETEAERDQLRATLDTMRRTEVERIAGTHIQKPEALWSAGVTLPDLLDDDGSVDPDKVTAAVQTARDTLGLATKRRAGIVPQEGTGTNRSTGGNQWQDAFKG